MQDGNPVCPRCGKPLLRVSIGAGDVFATCDRKYRRPGENGTRACGQKLFLHARRGVGVAVVGVGPDEFEEVLRDENALARFGIIQAAYRVLAQVTPPN